MSKALLEFGLTTYDQPHRVWPLPYELTFLIYEKLFTFHDRVEFMKTCRYFWVSCLARVPRNLAVTFSSGEIRTFSLKHRPSCSLYLGFEIVGSIIISYQDLARPISNIELIRFLKQFRQINDITFSYGAVLQQNVAGLQKFLLKRNSDTKITFENLHYSTDNNDEQPRFITSTGTDDISLSRPLKRTYHDAYASPPPLREEYKKQKLDLIELGLLTPRNHPVHTLIKLPRALDYLFSADTAYNIMVDTFDSSPLLERNGKNNHHKVACELVTQYAKRFVEMVILGNLSWICVTQFEVYWTNLKHVDDCALRRLINNDSGPKVVVVECRDFSNPYYQLVVRCDELELLATGGYYGSKGDRRRRAFLGSSLPLDMATQLMNDSGYIVTVPSGGADSVQSVRMLRDYGKKNASNPWSFESLQFAKGGFRASHALEYDQLPSRQNAKNATTADLTSLLLRITCSRVYTIRDQQNAIELLLKTKEGQIAIKKVKGAGHTIKSIYATMHSRSTTSKNMLTICSIFKSFEQELKNKEEVEITFIVISAKNDMINLYNNCLARYLKEENVKTLERFKG
ncbi:hypothetical protein INT45_008184 [Circinella minor]|uniref:Uncharacterized protein n=1 Tax=Circinella minor TaxID=1195481 RepID=A0A8H7VG10_9FUNG|nr:hypothetical protein INT45_008184 [Circinella minor]